MARKWQLLILILGIALIASGGIFFVMRDANPIPKGIRSSATFPLFYPTKLPANWQIDTNSFSQAASVVLFRVVDTANASRGVSISIQPQQESFDTDRFYKQTLAKSTQFTTALGQAAIGESEMGTRVGSIVTGDSWILVTAPINSASNADIRTILTSLAQ